MREIGQAELQPAARVERAQAAIAQAASRTGTSFDFLLAQARIESGLDSNAKAPTSSATGLFQFIDTTWLDMVHRHGARHGLADAAAAITAGNGKLQVSDPAMRTQILALRHDPDLSALMAGEYARENGAILAASLGRTPQSSELYLAHFLGAGGASRFLSALDTRADSPAASDFSEAAKANRAIFFHPSGSARSYSQVMAVIEGKVENAMAMPGGLRTSAYASASFPPPRRARAGSSAPLPMLQTAQARPPISAMLEQSFGLGNRASAAPDHAKRAYERLKAVGL